MTEPLRSKYADDDGDDDADDDGDDGDDDADDDGDEDDKVVEIQKCPASYSPCMRDDVLIFGKLKWRAIICSLYPIPRF